MLARAKQRYEELMIELATRKNNEHIGSGLGGNPEQYLTMLALTPNFSSANSKEMFSVHNDTIDINLDKIHFASRKEIRFALDKVLTSDIISKYTAPELVKFVDGTVRSLPSNIEDLFVSPKQKELIKVSLIAIRMKELVELELKEYGEIPTINSLSAELQQVYNEMKSMDKWLILFGCRTYLGIETMVKYNLDEVFFDMFTEINSVAGEPEKT